MATLRGRGPGTKAWVAALAGAGVAWGALSYVALTIGVFVEGYGYSLDLAALLATVELSALALASMSGGYLLRGVSLRALAVAGAALASAANALTALGTSPLAVGVLRAAVGLGLGWLSAGLNTALSRTRDPERLFIGANFGCITLAAGFFYVMPMIYERLSYPAYFLAYGALCAACALFMGWLPSGTPDGPAPRSVDAGAGGARWGLFGAVSSIWLCYSAVWALIERRGHDIGMSAEAIGASMGLGTLSGLLGAGAAAALAGRVRPLPALILTSFTTGLCYVWLAFCGGAVEYTAILCVWGVLFCPILAYAYAVGSEMDPSGALGRMIGGGVAISTALGPLVGARLQSLLGFSGVGWTTFAGTTLGCIMIGAVGLRGRPAPS